MPVGGGSADSAMILTVMLFRSLAGITHTTCRCAMPARLFIHVRECVHRHAVCPGYRRRTRSRVQSGCSGHQAPRLGCLPDSRVGAMVRVVGMALSLTSRHDPGLSRLCSFAIWRATRGGAGCQALVQVSRTTCRLFPTPRLNDTQKAVGKMLVLPTAVSKTQRGRERTRLSPTAR